MLEIANAFAGRGYAVDLLVFKPVGPYASMVDPRIRVISLEARRIIFSLPKLIVYFWRERPAALLSVDEHTHLLTLIARMIVRSRMRIVLRIGNMLSVLEKRYEGKARILPFLNRRIFKKADHLIANSRGVADDVIAVTGIEPSRVSVVMNPKPQEEIILKAKEPVAHEWFEHKTVPVVVAVGRLRIQKNFQLLIRAFAKLSKKIPAKLVIVGGGREGDRLKAVAREEKCAEDVHFAGYVDNPYAYVAKADCFVMTSLWEGLPNAVLEALVCGAPVIASDCSSGPRELLAPDTDYRKRLAASDGVEYAAYGILTPVGDEGALTEALSRILTDGALRSRYAQASIERSHEISKMDSIGAYVSALDPRA